MNSKKLMISITAMSLILVAVVVMVVHNTKPKEVKTIPITKESPAIGTWETEDHKSEEDANHVKLTFDKNGEAKGSFGKYDFEGTWQQIKDDTIDIVNQKGESIYQGVITDDTMDIKGVNVTDSMTWKLIKLGGSD